MSLHIVEYWTGSGSSIGTVLSMLTLYGFDGTVLLIYCNMLTVEKIASIKICFRPE